MGESQRATMHRNHARIDSSTKRGHGHAITRSCGQHELHSRTCKRRRNKQRARRAGGATRASRAVSSSGNVDGAGNAWPGTLYACGSRSARPSSMVKNGLPPDVSWIRRSVGPKKAVCSRARQEVVDLGQ